MPLSSNMQARKDAFGKGGKQPTFQMCSSISHIAIATLTDEMGYSWCQECAYRCDLMNWGKAHEWPLVCVDRYAIGEGKWLWNHFIKNGYDEAIRTLCDGLVSNNAQE